MDGWTKVTDELSVAGQLTQEQLLIVKESGFKSILNLRTFNENGFWNDEPEQVKLLGLNYSHIPVSLDTLTEELTTTILSTIDQLPKPALIHCASGMRAGAMTLMNVATRQGMTLTQTFELANQIGFDCNAFPQMKEFFKSYVEKHSQPTTT